MYQVAPARDPSVTDEEVGSNAFPKSHTDALAKGRILTGSRLQDNLRPTSGRTISYSDAGARISYSDSGALATQVSE